MIINIPTKADFDESANNLLNLAWDQITALLNEYSQLSDTFYDTQFDESDKTRYWNAARQTLTTSLTLIQQAVEFFYKKENGCYFSVSHNFGYSFLLAKRCEK